MANGERNSMELIYRAAVIILLALAGFISANVYNKVDKMPSEFVTLERYKCDIEKIEKGLSTINLKLDQFISKGVGP